MKKILKINNQMMEMIKEPAFYKLRIAVWGMCDCVLIAEKYAYNPKRYFGLLLKIYLNSQLKKFKKILENNCYFVLSDDDNYTFDDNYSYEKVLSNNYGDDVNVILTPAKETLDLFLEFEEVDKFIKER